MPTYSSDNLDKNLDQATRDIMLDVILQWARYDSLVAQWVVLAFGMGLDSGSILLGNMDTRTKLERLKALYAHHARPTNVATLSALQKAHSNHVAVRNAIAHSTCAGRWKTDPERIVFAPVKPFKGELGQMLVEHIHLDQMRAATAFASSAADKIMKITDALLAQHQQPSPEPPSSPPASHPSPRKSGTGKRPPQPPKKRG